MIGRRVKTPDLFYVIPGLLIGRNPAKFSHGPLTRVITGQRQRYVAFEMGEQLAQIGHAAPNIVCRIEDIAHAKTSGGCRYELHQALRLF